MKMKASEVKPGMFIEYETSRKLLNALIIEKNIISSQLGNYIVLKLLGLDSDFHPRIFASRMLVKAESIGVLIPNSLRNQKAIRRIFDNA